MSDLDPGLETIWVYECMKFQTDIYTERGSSSGDDRGL